jgi:hypothetical protein
MMIRESFEKLHKNSCLVIPRIKYGAGSAKAGINYLFMVPRFHGDDALIPACAGMTGREVFQRSREN